MQRFTDFRHNMWSLTRCSSAVEPIYLSMLNASIHTYSATPPSHCDVNLERHYSCPVIDNPAWLQQIVQQNRTKDTVSAPSVRLSNVVRPALHTYIQPCRRINTEPAILNTSLIASRRRVHGLFLVAGMTTDISPWNVRRWSAIRGLLWSSVDGEGDVKISRPIHVIDVPVLTGFEPRTFKRLHENHDRVEACQPPMIHEQRPTTTTTSSLERPGFETVDDEVRTVGERLVVECITTISSPAVQRVVQPQTERTTTHTPHTPRTHCHQLKTNM